MKALLLTLAFSMGFSAHAIKIEWQEKPVSVEKDWDQFLLSFKPHMKNPEDFLKARGSELVEEANTYLRIAPLAEVPNTLVLGFNYPIAMNMALMRASVFIEKLSQFYGSRPPILRVDYRPVIRDIELVDAALMLGGGGHDLRAADMLSFWRVMDQIDKSELGPSPTKDFDELIKIEAQVREALEPYFEQHPDAALIAFSVDSYNTGVVTHEISHAQFFNNPKYHEAVLEYWKKIMTDAERNQARDLLSSGNSGVAYGRSLEELMINEFQAHLTSVNAHYWPILEPMHDPHHTMLRAHLKNSIPGSRWIDIPMPEGSDEYRLPMCSKYLVAPAK